MQAQDDIRSYLNIIRRRRNYIIVPALVIFGLSVLLALTLPPVYRSTATVLIETQNVSKDFLQTTVSGYVEQRLQSISQVVLGRVNLTNLIKKMSLYPDLQNLFTMEEIVSDMQKDIRLEPVQAEVNNPLIGRSGPATIAFNISYDGRNPNTVAQVTSELVSLFLQENLKSREETAKATVDFLEKQQEEIRQEMLDLEQKISAFKERHITELPELMNFNMATMDKLEKDRGTLEETIRSLQARAVYLEGQLAAVDPYAGGLEGSRMPSPREEQERLRRRYVSLKSTLSAQHPDVQKAQREYEAVSGAPAGGASSEDVKLINEVLREKQQKLATLTETRSEKHPDVANLKREIAELERSKQGAPGKGAAPSTDTPTNPAYINLKTQVATTQMEMRRAQAELGRISAMQANYMRRVEETPKVEQEYQSLHRDYESAKLKYNDLAKRVLAARESKGLEESQIGDKFTLIAPPLVPEKPVKPKRALIVLAGLVVALAAGLGLAMLMETLDQSVTSPEEISEISGAAVLVSVPYLATPQETQKRSLRRRLVVYAVIAAVLLVLAVMHFVYMPLDILLLTSLRKARMLF